MPYITVATPNKVHVPVMIAPIGKIRIFVPGRMNTVLVEIAAPEVVVAAEAPVVADEAPVVAALPENAPTTKAAWVEFRVVLKTGTFAALMAVRVTVGRTAASN